MKFSEYIVYVDETGDHGLETIDPDYPLFGLTFCIFQKKDYMEKVVPAVVGLKFDTFGHDMLILHEHDIRKKRGAFHAMNKDARDVFIDRLSVLIQEAPFTIIAVIINKQALADHYSKPDNPYSLGMKFGLERLYHFLSGTSSLDGITHVVFEARGNKEDHQLELEFRRVCDGANGSGRELPFEIRIAHKQCNSAGLQLADLTARPIGLSVLRPHQTIVTDQKHPKEFKVTRYRQATDAIIDFLACGGNDVSVIWTVIGELQRKRPRTEFQEQDRVLNIEALESFLELLNGYSFEGIACTRISGPTGTLNMSGVSISVQPNLIVRCTNRNGDLLLGEIKLCFSKTHPLDREAGEYVGTALYEHAQMTMSDQGKIDPRYCLVIDVFAGKVHMAPRAYITRKRDMKAACVEIALHWQAA